MLFPNQAEPRLAFVEALHYSEPIHIAMQLGKVASETGSGRWFVRRVISPVAVGCVGSCLCRVEFPITPRLAKGCDLGPRSATSTPLKLVGGGGRRLKLFSDLPSSSVACCAVGKSANASFNQPPIRQQYGRRCFGKRRICTRTRTSATDLAAKALSWLHPSSLSQEAADDDR